MSAPSGIAWIIASLTVRASRCAAVGVITELVNVEASQSIGIITADVVCDRGWGGFGRLLESNSATDLAVTSEECD